MQKLLILSLLLINSLVLTSCNTIDLELNKVVADCEILIGAGGAVSFDNNGEGDLGFGKCERFDKNGGVGIIASYTLIYTPYEDYMEDSDTCTYNDSVSGAGIVTVSTYKVTINYSNPKAPVCTRVLTNTTTSGGGGGAILF